MSNAVRVDLSVDQGADFAAEIYWTDYYNNPFAIESPIRMDVRDEVTTVMEFVAYPTGEEGELSEDVSIRYNSDRGLIQLLISSEKTKDVPAGNYFYDLFVTYRDQFQDPATGEMMNTTRLSKIMYGRMNIRARITKNI